MSNPLTEIKPLVPRITKNTAVAKVQAMFPTTSDLLKRFELAKNQANLWDGERDGIREAVKLIKAGRYEDVILEKSKGSEVLYPNAEGKHQLEDCLQTTIPSMDIPAETEVIALLGFSSPAHLLETILHTLQSSKADALALLENAFIGAGHIVDNESLYEKKGSEKATITILPKEAKP